MTKYYGLIALDGPDATGKTTLANKICAMTGGEVIHLTWTKYLAPVQVMHKYRINAIKYAAALSEDRVVVIERPWLSHPIYSTVYRDGKFDHEDVREWKDCIEMTECMSITALPRAEHEWMSNYSSCCQKREETHGRTFVQMKKVLHQFQAACLLGLQEYSPGQYEGAKHAIYDYQSDGSKVEKFVKEYVFPNLHKHQPKEES